MVTLTNDTLIYSHYHHIHILAATQSTPQDVLAELNSEIGQLSLDVDKLSPCGFSAKTILDNCSATSTTGAQLADGISAYIKAHPGATTLSPELTAEFNSFQANFTLYNNQAQCWVGP